MVELKVPDMTCGHCAGTVTRAIKSIDPGADVQVDLRAKTVSAKTTATREQVSKALDEAGYSNSASL